MAKKPVIFVFTTAYFPFIGGAEVAIEQVANRLGHKFDFVIFTSRMDKNLPKREMRSVGLVVRIGFGTRLDKYLLPVIAPFYVWKLKIENWKLTWGMDFSFGSLAAVLLKIFYPRVPLVFTIQYGYGDERVAKERFGLMNLALHLILMQADYVTAISSYLLELCKKYGFIGEAEVIHNGVDIQKFEIRSSKSETNPRNQSTKTIITVSRLVPKNGVDILIKAVVELKHQLPTSNPQLLIVGDGPERKNLEALAERVTHPPTPSLKVREGEKNRDPISVFGGGLITFHGSVLYNDLPKYLAEADVFVRPSRSEGMGNAFVEALAVGLPIIGTPVGGIPDIIKDGETGLFAKVDDPTDLAEKIKILLEDKKFAERIVANGRKMVAERFDWDKIAKSYGEVFEHELCVRKRILIVTGIFPPEVGGPATYSKILLDELPKRGLGVRVSAFSSVRRLPKILRHIAYGIKLIAYGLNADIIFAQDPVSVGLPAAIAAKILRKKFLLKVVGDYAWEQGVQRFGVKEVLDDYFKNKYRWQVEFFRKIERWVANRAEKIIVPSEYLKGVVERWGARGEKIAVVYNTFESPKLDISKEDARKRLGISGKILVSAGRNVPWKGFQTLRDLMPEILRKFPDAKLFILNNEPREKLLLYLRAADLFVLNTSYEGFSHQILEAMALGVPVVTTDSGGNPELVEDGKSGFLVKFNDKKALTEKISKVLSDGVLARKLSENAQKKAQEFTLERMINDTIKVID